MEVLVIEDDKKIASYIKKEIEKSGHSATITHSVKEAIEKKLANSHDIVVLDLILTNERGEDFVQYIKKNNIKIPIIVLSSLSEVVSKVELLKLGVDDYMTKPFDPRELIARLESTRRIYLSLDSDKKETHCGIEFNWKDNSVLREGKKIHLTKKECSLLKLLVRNKNNVVSSEDILSQVWNVGLGYHSNILQSLVRHLRKRLDQDFEFKLIRNVHGYGYMLVFPDLDTE